jgi:hypothetical protein
MPGKIRVLFLLANPKNTSALRLGEEVRAIGEEIDKGSAREAFELISHLAVRPRDLQRLLLKHQPHIVHFCGHGSSTEEIILEDDAGQSKPVSREALAALFRILKDNIRIIVLNACFSKAQAEALNQHIDFTLGMKKAVADKMAIAFMGAFYLALASGRSVDTAFELGKVELDLGSIAGSDQPELFVKSGVDAMQPFVS